MKTNSIINNICTALVCAFCTLNHTALANDCNVNILASIGKEIITDYDLEMFQKFSHKIDQKSLEWSENQALDNYVERKLIAQFLQDNPDINKFCNSYEKFMSDLIGNSISSIENAADLKAYVERSDFEKYIYMEECYYRFFRLQLISNMFKDIDISEESVHEKMKSQNLNIYDKMLKKMVTQQMQLEKANIGMMSQIESLKKQVFVEKVEKENVNQDLNDASEA